MVPRLLKKYRQEIVPALKAEFGYKSVMAVPRIMKVTLNAGFGRIAKDEKAVEKIKQDLAKISGQAPTAKKAKKSIAGFKIRQGVIIGAAVTLRGNRMYDFIDRLVSVSLPRSRDFRGLEPKSFDQKGNFSIGIKESSIFPEISYESLKDIFGLEITVTTSARTRKGGERLLRLMGFPIKHG